MANVKLYIYVLTISALEEMVAQIRMHVRLLSLGFRARGKGSSTAGYEGAQERYDASQL